MSDQIKHIEQMTFRNAAAEADYHAFVGTAGNMFAREARGDEWRIAHPNDWCVRTTPPDPTTAAKAAWAYRVEKPQPAAVNPVDSRGAHEGYDTWNFDICHPALRR